MRKGRRCTSEIPLPRRRWRCRLSLTEPATPIGKYPGESLQSDSNPVRSVGSHPSRESCQVDLRKGRTLGLVPRMSSQFSSSRHIGSFMRPFRNPAVASAFEAYPPTVRPSLLALRELIFETAAMTDGVGALEETLRWGEPAYVTSASGSGSTVRIDWKRSTPGQYAMYFHCQTNLVETFRTLFPNEFKYEGNRALVFDQDAKVPRDALGFCIAASLTYHLRKKTPRGRRHTSSAPHGG